jgi:hypothetical protein
MTPYAHHSNNTYLRAYQAELAHDLSEAHSRGVGFHSIRRSIARSLVRIGAWLLPEKTELVDGTIHVLKVDPHVSASQRAA